MTADERARHLAVVAARAAADRKAQDIIALDVSERLPLTDIFLVASGRNERQVSGVVDAIEEALYREGVKPRRKEGQSQARWVLVDFGDIIVHVQHAEDRVYYSLERLWKDCPVVELPDDLYGPAGDDDTDDDAAGTGGPGADGAHGTWRGEHA